MLEGAKRIMGKRLDAATGFAILKLLLLRAFHF
jgi:hypothetical protein